MKVYSLYCAYWSAWDWHKWTDLNYSINPTGSKILGVYLSGSEAIIAMNELKSDPDYTLDLCVYESYDIDEEDIKEYLRENELTLDDIHKLTVGEWTDIATKDELLRWDIDCRIIDQETPELYGDEIIISWEYYRYVGYARRFKGIYTADELGFKNEADLATGNEDSTYKINFSMLLDHKELKNIPAEDLENEILNRMFENWKWTNDSQNRMFENWKWTNDSHFSREIHHKFGTKEIEED